VGFALLSNAPDNPKLLTPTRELSFIDFELPDLEGAPQALSQWQGKLILLNFWATWCPPCREEMPVFIELQKRYRDRNLQIIGVAIDEIKAVAEYNESMAINYPILIGNDKVMDLMKDYGNPMGNLPYSVLISPDGEVFRSKLGAFTRSELDQLLSPYLATEKGR
ncbi:MAG: TlpA family protein disulfide reductase, partial [Gammaproteobacteria bacterium]|nr:TlpA family protein disulfide reductase [Gammaproteobacteria bacterium]